MNVHPVCMYVCMYVCANNFVSFVMFRKPFSCIVKPFPSLRSTLTCCHSRILRYFTSTSTNTYIQFHTFMVTYLLTYIHTYIYLGAYGDHDEGLDRQSHPPFGRPIFGSDQGWGDEDISKYSV